MKKLISLFLTNKKLKIDLIQNCGVVQSERGGSMILLFGEFCAKQKSFIRLRYLTHPIIRSDKTFCFLENDVFNVDKFKVNPEHVGEIILSSSYLLNKVPQKKTYKYILIYEQVQNLL